MFVIHERNVGSNKYIRTYGSFETKEEAEEAKAFFEEQDAVLYEDHDKGYDRLYEDVSYEIDTIEDASVPGLNYFEV